MKRLYKSRSDRVISGVCGGIAKYFSVDPTLIRVIWVISFLIGGVGFFGYIIAMIIIPTEPYSQKGSDKKVDVFESNTSSFSDDGFDTDSSFLNIDKSKAKSSLPIILGAVLIGFGILVLASTLGFFDFRILGKIFIPVVIIGLGLFFVLNSKK
ncbi:MAG: PspC domain-containing protein [Caldisericia bacterium]